MMAETDEADIWFQRGKQHFPPPAFKEELDFKEVADFKEKEVDSQGNVTYHIGEAIACFDRALQIEPDHPMVLIYKGIALLFIARYADAYTCFDRALQIKPKLPIALAYKGITLVSFDPREAIECFDQALQTELSSDLLHTVLQHKGVALANLKCHEEAISCYDRALVLRLNPLTLYNKGVELLEIGRPEESVLCFDQALQNFSDPWLVWKHKGHALRELGRYEEALECYKEFLNSERKDIKGTVNVLYWQGNTLSLMGRIEEAIESFDRALSIEPDCWQIWEQRGRTIRNSQSETITSSPPVIVSPFPALNQPKYHQYHREIANYEEGLKHIKQSTEPKGWGCLHKAIGQAHYLYGCLQSRADIYHHKALKSFYTALKTLTLEKFPQAHLWLVQDLTQVYLDLGDVQAANSWKAYWREQGFNVFRQKLNTTPSPGVRRNIAKEFSQSWQLDVDKLVQDGEFMKALEVAEWNKNSALTWILEAWKERVVSPSHEEMRGLLGEKTAVVYWHLSPEILTTFTLKPDAQTPVVVEAADGFSKLLSVQKHQDLESWLREWNRDYQDYRGKKGDKQRNRRDRPWRKNLAFRLERLKEILQIGAIEAELTGITQLILIPHRDLHRLPLHALFSDRFIITYLPSVQIGLNLKKKQPSASDAWHECSLLSIEAPVQTEMPLKFAETESEIISCFFQTPTRIASEQATQTNLDSALQQTHQIFHFTGHGAYNLHQPQRSALGLIGEEQLTAEEIAKTDLSSYELAVLSACETAITGNQMIETEYVGLVSAFLQAGVTNVISTLWMVDEISNAWFTIYFYQQLLAGHSPAIALKQTQDWMRRLTRSELATWLSQLSQLDRLDINTKIRLQQFAAIAQNDDLIQDSDTMSISLPPYEPYHWAAFTITGKVTS